MTTWVTGRDVNVNDLAVDKAPPPEAEDVEAEGLEAPAPSANKDAWLEFRAGQGYTDEQLNGLTKDQLVELPDDPAEFEG